jgi:uncharacterized protein YjiS (DUF1127 family)
MTRIAPGTRGSTFTMALAGIMLSAVKRMFVAIRNRRQVARLTDLDERTLKDIGLTRSEVMAALDQPLLRDPSMHLASVAGVRRGRPAAGLQADKALPGGSAAKPRRSVETVMPAACQPRV